MLDLTAAVVGLLFVLSATLPFWFAYHDARYRKQATQRWSTQNHVSELSPASLPVEDFDPLRIARQSPADEPIQVIMSDVSGDPADASTNVCLGTM